MKKNVGNTDMWIRIILGVIIITLGIFYQSWWGVIGVVALATAFIRWCPAYLPFGINTSKKESE